MGESTPSYKTGEEEASTFGSSSTRGSEPEPRAFWHPWLIFETTTGSISLSHLLSQALLELVRRDLVIAWDLDRIPRGNGAQRRLQ